MAQLEAGRISSDIGPFTVIAGMNAQDAEAELPPNEPELLINIDIDRNGRAVARPGSIFFARIGEGPILGMAEHSFESGLETRKLVERAKEVLMQRLQIQGDAAYRWIQKRSMDSRKSMRDVAEAVLLSSEIYDT